MVTKDHILHIFKDFGSVVKMFTKSISPISVQELLMDLGYCQTITIFCLIVLVMDIWVVNGNGQTENHGIS